MESNLNNIAVDLYGKIGTRFPNIKIGDSKAEVLSKKSDIHKARFFEFEYEEHGEQLGTITITLDADDGIVIQMSGDLTDDNAPGHNAYKFIRSFRQFAKSRLLNFDVQNIGKSNLDKRDYLFRAKSKETNVMESKMFGTSKISYQNLGEARLVIKHSQPIKENLAAGRTMHIESIYIENADGERFRYPFKHLHGARALAEHVNHGGNPYDAIGKYVIRLSEELGHLRKFNGYVSRQQQISEAMSTVTDRSVQRVTEIKKELANLQRPAYYEQFSENFVEPTNRKIPESVMTDWVNRLTIRTFNEDLTNAFQFLYNIVDESTLPVHTLDVADLLTDNTFESTYDKAYDPYLHPEDNFATFIESIVLEDKNELFSPNKGAQQNAITKLNDIMKSELPGGPDGVNAIKSLAGIIDDTEFLEILRDIDPDLDVRSMIQAYIKSVDPTVALQIHFNSDSDSASGSDMPMTSAEQGLPPPGSPDAAQQGSGGEMPPPPAGDTGEMPPEPPLSESDMKKLKLKSQFIKANKAGVTLETKFGDRMTIRDALRESGLTAAECGFSEDIGLTGVDEIWESIRGFWNAEERNFTIGGTRAKTKIVKNFKEGKYNNASVGDVKQVLAKIEKMDPSVHGHEPTPDNDRSREQSDIMILAGLR